MSAFEKFQELIQDAYDLEPSPVAVTLAEEAVRIADSQLSIAQQFWARTHLVRLCFMSGKPLPMLVAIAWSLAVIDRKEYEPDAEELEIMLWQCKHAVTYSSSFTTISYEQYRKLYEDVVKRYIAAGASPRSVHQIGSSCELFMGKFAAADECIQKARQAPRDQYAETHAWEVFFEADHFLSRDQNEDALRLMEPMLADPVQARDVDPWFVSSSMFELLRTGRQEEAVIHQRRALKKVSGNAKFISQIANHICFLAMIHDDVQAVKLVEQHLEIGLTAPDQSSRLDFCLNCWFLLQSLKKRGRSEIQLRFPDLSSLHEPDGTQRKELPPGKNGRFDLDELSVWFQKDYQKLADQFRIRNENEHVDNLIDRVIRRLS